MARVWLMQALLNLFTGKTGDGLLERQLLSRGRSSSWPTRVSTGAKW
jgi:hypothetical protein